MPNGAGRLFQGSVTSTRLREKTMVLYGDFVYPGDLRIVHSTLTLFIILVNSTEASGASALMRSDD